ncbi:MAG: hypothetical protein ACI9UN_000483 [Granulosicoccus sp.]|jgi:hypothetical protein
MGDYPAMDDAQLMQAYAGGDASLKSKKYAYPNR